MFHLFFVVNRTNDIQCKNNCRKSEVQLPKFTENPKCYFRKSLKSEVQLSIIYLIHSGATEARC